MKLLSHLLVFSLVYCCSALELCASEVFGESREQDRVSRSDHPAIERKDANSITAHKQLLEKTKQGQIDLYFAGDSITRRWGATDYPELLQHWRETFHGWNAANFAWGGDRTQNILWRLQNGELEGLTPRVVVLLAGTNNLSTRRDEQEQVDEVVAGITAILDLFKAKTPKATIVLMAILPRNDQRELLPVINKINARLEKLAERDEVRFLNINHRLADESGELYEGMTVDRLHLSKKGYEQWADELKPLLTELLGPPSKVDNAPPPTGDPSAGR